MFNAKSKQLAKEKVLFGVQACIINFLSGRAKNFNQKHIDLILQMEYEDFKITNTEDDFLCCFFPRIQLGLIDHISEDEFAITRYEDDLYIVVLPQVAV